MFIFTSLATFQVNFIQSYCAWSTLYVFKKETAHIYSIIIIFKKKKINLF